MTQHQNKTQTPKSPKWVKVYGLDRFGRKYRVDVDEEELDQLYELLLKIVGINDVVKTIVLYCENDEGEPYRIIIKY